MDEAPEVTLRRQRMRAWRRGTREMDLILGPFADDQLPALPASDRALFDRLLAENDHDLYLWLTARVSPGQGDLEPRLYASLLDRIARHAVERLRKCAAMQQA